MEWVNWLRTARVSCLDMGRYLSGQPRLEALPHAGLQEPLQLVDVGRLDHGVVVKLGVELVDELLQLLELVPVHDAQLGLHLLQHFGNLQPETRLA